MVLGFPRISSRVLQPFAPYRTKSPEDIRVIVRDINQGCLEPEREYFTLLGSDTLEEMACRHLVIVFSKSLRPPVNRSVE